MADLYSDTEQNCTRRLMDGPDLTLPDTMLICVCVWTNVSDLSQRHDKAIDPSCNWMASTEARQEQSGKVLCLSCALNL